MNNFFCKLGWHKWTKWCKPYVERLLIFDTSTQHCQCVRCKKIKEDWWSPDDPEKILKVKIKRKPI